MLPRKANGTAMNIKRIYLRGLNIYFSGSHKDYTRNLIVYFGRFKFPIAGHLSSNLAAEKSTTHSLLKKSFKHKKENT
jgi:hypothetical protein